MLARILERLSFLLVAFFVLLVASDAYSAGLPDGIKVTVIAEYPSRLPDVEKMRLVKVVLQPGAVLENIVVENDEYCRLEQGQLTRINHDTGATDVYTTGSLWAPQKGEHHTVTNTGDLDAIMWAYQLLAKGESEGTKM